MKMIELTQNEVSNALYIAGRRNDTAIREGRQARFNDSNQSVHTQSAEILMGHFMGAAGEMALCRALGIKWSQSIDTYHSEPDVIYKGIPIEVKCSGGDGVQIRDNDSHLKDDDIVVAVQRQLTNYDKKVFTMHKYKVRGWFFAGEARRDEHIDMRFGDKGRDRWYFEGPFRPLGTLGEKDGK